MVAFGTGRAHGTGLAHGLGKRHLDLSLPLGPLTPRAALLALWAEDAVRAPVDVKVRQIKALARQRLPGRIRGHGADDAHAWGMLDQHLTLQIAAIQQVLLWQELALRQLLLHLQGVLDVGSGRKRRLDL